MEGEENPAKVVLIDSKTSFANRAEATTTEAMRNGEGILSKMPHIAVEYDVDDGKNVCMNSLIAGCSLELLYCKKLYCFYCLALGHVWRDSYVPQTDATSREERYWDLVDAIKSKTSHFRIFDWHAVYRVNMTDYAHHADSSNVLHGMQALVAISDGADSLDCAAMAIGQSRHLGGGLLVPVDLYLSSLRPDEDFGKGVPTWLK